MKRIGNLYAEITSIENLQLADQKARKGKSGQYGIKQFDRNPQEKLLQLQQMLISKDYKTSPYETFKVYEPKEREVYRLPYFPDRITHHAVMNVLEPIFTAVLTKDTYSCIKGKGIYGMQKAVLTALQDAVGTKYCLKLDIVKFYPNVNHDTLKALLRKKFKDADLLWLLDEIIDSAPGIPIGNYLSQYFANFYLTYFDHWIKEEIGVKYYFRYADDIVIFSDNKPFLQNLLGKIREYLSENLRLSIKRNYRVFPVSTGVDVGGYVYFPTHTRLRKSIKQALCRKLRKNCKLASVAAYNGWLKHCNSINLQTKLYNQHEQFRRFQDRCKKGVIRGRPQENIESPEHGHIGTEIQDCTVQI